MDEPARGELVLPGGWTCGRVYAPVAAGAPVGALHRLLTLAHAAALARARWRDAVQLHLQRQMSLFRQLLTLNL